MRKITLLAFIALFSSLSYAQTPCSPVSPLDCSTVETALPVVLDFNSSVPNTILDQAGLGTGFTTVMEHSEARQGGDLAVSDPAVNGYEPSLLTLSGGSLQLLSQGGIAFRNPNFSGGSSNNNNQVNTLGVGMDDLSGVIIIKTRLNNIVTGGGSAQAGIWYGYDEDNFVKLDVNASNIELRVEVDGLSGNGTTGSDQVQSDVGASGNDVDLELVIDRGTLTAQAFYVIGNGSRTLLGSLPVPESYFTGRDINTSGGQDNMSFAGIFASHRNGAQFTASFDEFSVERPPALPFEAHVNFMSERLGNNNGALIDAPTGYDKDFGQAFGTNQTASGNDYGWKSKATGAPLDASHLAAGNSNGVGRNRLGNGYGSASDQAKLEGTLVHFQGDNIRGNDGSASWGGQPRGTELFWEMEIPNGTYDVTIGLGDDGADIDSRHSATVEGFTVVPAFVPSEGENRNATITVAVNDGLLTVGGDGGFNSKINYIDVVESAGIPVSESLTFNPDLMDVELVSGTIGTFSNTLAGNGTVPIGLVIEDNVNGTDKNATGSNDWLTLPTTVGIGELDFAIDAAALSEGDTRANSIIATAQGLRPAALLVTLTVVAPSSTETQITSFELAEQTDPAAFGPNVIDIEVANGTDLTQLAPTITVSPGASISPDSGVATDFSLGAVTYTVTAEDGITTLDWQVTVTEAAAVNQAPVVENQSFEVAEDVLVGTLVGSVTATDTDTNDLTYTITAGNDSGAFAVSSSTGEITTATELDFENLAQYVLTVEVSDGELSDTADLTISVTDVTETIPFAAFVNFQNSAVTPPSGYLADFGKGFGTSSVSIGSEEYAYGWKRLSDGLAVDVSEDAGGNSNGAGRNRLAGGYAGATDQEKLEGSLMHFQGDNVLDQTGGQPSWAGQPRGDELFWELEVPNGVYQVTLGLGDKDQNNVDSRHSATLEGYTIIPAFVPIPGQTEVETMVVEVTDGFLTMTGLGGFNSKITHIEVIESTDIPVNGTLSFDPSVLTETLIAGNTGTISSSLTGTGATVIGLVIDDNINIENKNNTGFNDWLTLPGTNTTGSFDFAIDASDLAEGDTRNNTIIATAKGFAPAMLNADLTVIGAPVDIPQLVINEIMSNPNAVGDSLGEWFEIYNSGTEAVNINGWTIRDNDTNSHAIDAEGGELLIPPSAYVVLGNNADVATNGGKLIDYEYGGFQLANTADEIVLVDNDDNEIDRVEYNEATFPSAEGASMALNDPADDNNIGGNWSAATSAYGTGDLGTPGLANNAKANESPAITSLNAVSVEENKAVAIDIEVTDDLDTEGSGIAYTLTGNTDDALFDINGQTGVLSFLSPPDFETPLDGNADNVYNVQVVVTDSGSLLDTQALAITVTDVAESVPCNPLSTLPCNQIAGTLPLALDFTSANGNLSESGFTMVLEPSSRLASDDALADADVPGYAPSLISQDASGLTINSTKGIFYSQLPSQGSPNSTDTNSQMNALGTGIVAPSVVFNISTTLNNPDFSVSAGNSSQQAGIWYGLDEDHIIKLVVAKTGNTTRKIQLQVENMDETTQEAAYPELNTGNIASNTGDLSLRLELDPVNLTAKGYYSLNGGAEILVTEGGEDNLSVPASYFAGTSYDADIPSETLNFSGIFTTHRRAAVDQSIAVLFKSFEVAEEQQPLALSFDVETLNFTGTVGEAIAPKTVSVSASSGNPTFKLSDDPDASSWLILPAGTVTLTDNTLAFPLGDIEFGIQEGLPAATYSTTIFATDEPDSDYDNAELRINLEITEVGTPQTPRVVSVTPADGATDVAVNASISANDLFLPNVDGDGNSGVDNSTITSATVKLFKQGSTTPVGASVNGTGGGDAINLVPNLPLETNTTYVFEIDGVLDLVGEPFELFTSTFTTGGGNTGPTTDLDNVSFARAGTVASGSKYSTLTIGPDGKLYGLVISGDIHRWTISADGTLADQETLSGWKSAYANRTSVGMVFDPTATAGNLIAYVSHNSGGLNGAPDWDGKISRISGVSLETEELLVTDLPRSTKDHLTNSLTFKPGEPNVLYFNQGSNSAAGKPDGSWGNREESLLTAATLRLDLTKLPTALPLNVRTTRNQTAINNVDINSPVLDGLYNPYFVDAPLTLFATGIRNAYDLVWHSNGQLYVPTNGTAGGSNAPASVDGTRRPDGTFYDYSNPLYPIVPFSDGNNTQRDWLFRVDPNSSIGYYGHPNPFRGEYVLNRGDIDVNKSAYDGVQPDENYRGAAFDFELNKSPNGVIEYRSDAENGNLKGALLVVRYSGSSDIIALVPDGPNGDITTSKEGIPGFGGFQDPLDLIEDVSTGNIYVSDYGRSEIVLLKPSNEAVPTPRIVLNADAVTVDAVTNSTFTQEVLLSNLGNATLNAIDVQLSGANADQFSITGLPTTINAQNSGSFSILFTPTSNGPKYAELVISGTDAESVTIPLSGLGKNGLGGNNEPSLQWILDTQLAAGVVNVGDTNAATNIIDLPNGATYNDVFGDEVAVQQFERAIDAPVTLELLSVYGPTANNPITAFGWYPSGDAASTNELFTIGNDPASNGQTLNAPVNGATEFDPGTQSFGFYSRWPFFNNRQLYSEDALNTFNGAIPHHVRVYELPGEDDAYIIATEEHISGFDYQDIVVIARNVRPFSENPPIACSPISTLDCDELEVALPFSLDFDGTEGGLANTGFTMVDDPSARIAADGPISNPNVPGYEPSRLSVSNGTLVINANNGIAFRTNGTGAAFSSDVNSQINTLGVGIDADANGNFSIATTIVNPYTDGSNNSEQGGIWFGLDEDNFVKFVTNVAGELELRKELDGISANVEGDQLTLAVAGLNNSTVVLRLYIDLSAETMTAFYTLNNGAEVQMGTMALPAEFVAGNEDYDNLSFAGIFATKRRELTADVNYTFENFSIVSDNVVAFEPIRINYSLPEDIPPAGYFVDSGLGYGDRGDGNTYGWLTVDGTNPLNLSANARNRGIAGVDILRNTLMHMQYGDVGGSNGVATEGIWEIEVPNGSYNVTVGVGDPEAVGPNGTGSEHTINIEGVNAINAFVPTGVDGAATQFASATLNVMVTDGRLTLDAQGGFNTKINSLEITQGGAIDQPFFANVSPANNAINVAINEFQITVDVVVPEGYELDDTTLDGNVNLYEIVNGSEVLVPSNSNDTGGGDAITLTPLNSLKAFTEYRFRLTSGIEANLFGDLNDRLPFVAFSSDFTTGDVDTLTPLDLTGVEFTKVQGGAALGEGTSNQRFTSLVVGPDGKLYGSTIGDFQSDGQIYRWDMAADGTLENLEVLSPELQGAPHPVTGARNNGDRLIIGFAFDPAATADNLIAYITHSFASETSGPEWDGVISRLSGPNLNTVEDLIIHLPRSTKDHLTNSLTFGPDGAMYLNQGSNSAGGEPDSSWGFRPERLLAAAVLKLEVDKLPTTLPLSAYTTDDIPTINAAPAGSLTMSDGTYNPYATNAPLTVFASGVRNAYDLVWHSNGWLYVPTNGTAGGSNTPGTANYPLARRIDGRTTVPFTPPTNGNETQKDWLFKTKGGSYHGHPNPYRGEFILNHGGAPYSGVPGQQETSYTDVAKYPDDLGPDPNYSEPAYDFEFNKSPNGVIEYQSDAFGGRLQGLLMVVRFSGQDDLLVMQPEANGNIGNVNGDVPGLGGFDDPLDVVEDPKTGNLYVSEYDRGGNNNTRITLLRANVPATQGPEIAAAPTELIFETTVNDEGERTDTKTVEITNEGNAVLNITSAAITGDFADQFNAVQPAGATTINPGESQVYEVTFAPDLDNTDLGYQEAALTLASDATGNPSFSVGLHALKKAGFEGGQEPALQDVVDALGIGIDVGWTSLASTTDPIVQGDEVQVQRWIKATDAPINVTPVGRYSPAEELPFGWYTNDGDIETNEVGILAGGIENAQTLFPPIASGDASFDPQGAVFGFYVESNSFGRFNYTEDGINTGGVAHRTRVYPMADRDGNPIENSYLINFEDATNGDYQDYMFIIDNVIAFEDGILALEFDKGDLDFIASLNQETIPAQQVILTGNGGITTQEIDLIASEEWLILPETYELGTAFDVNVDLEGLPIGSYHATITAAASFYTDAIIDITLEVTNELVYTYQFNFQTPDDIEISPEGYIDDIGAPYGEQSTILGDLTYGWVLPGTLTPADAGVNGRNRDSGIQDGVLRQTFTIIGHPTPATYPQRDWVVNVPNGTYSVNISVGERDFTNSNHILDVNGTTVVDFDQENGNPDNLVYGEGTKFVDVTDGLLRLSLNPLGNNAKPNYIHLAPIDNSLLPPTITATFDGNQSGPDTYRGTVAISLEASDNSESGSIVRLEYALDGAAAETYDQPILVGDIGARSLTVIAEDGNGNITERTFDFTLEAATGALLAIENMTKVPGTDRGFPANDYYTFHRLGNPGQAAVHDANVMRLNNTGTGDLVINDAIISDTDDYTYEVLDAAGTVTAFPITVPVGSYADLDITFIGTTGNGNNGIFVENIEIVSNADNALENSAVLHGAYSPQPEGGDEINAQEVFDAFGFQSSMLSIVNDQGNITPPNDIRFRPSSNFPLPENVDAGYEGDMILSDTFVQADPSQPVIGIQLSALHGPGSNGARFVEVDGTGTVGGMSFSHDGAYYQTLLPKSGANINFDTATTINEPFRIAVANYLTSGGNNINGNRPDLLGLRMYKVIDQDGNIIPNEYIALQDFVQGGCGAGSANCDWNDNTFYFINIRPEGVPTAEPAEAYLANVGEALELDIAQYFDKGYPGNSLTISASVVNGRLPVWLTYNEVEGTLTGTPPNDATGSIDVIFDAVDTNGLTTTTTLTVNINEAPAAVDDEITTTQNVAVLLDALLANDSEPNGQDISILTVDSPLNGEAVLQEDGLSVLYTPDVDYVGSDSFTYTVADESGLTATANVSITVEPENQAPEALIVTNIDEGPAALFVEFTGSGSTDEKPSTLQYAWDFGDGLGTATDADTSYTFTSAGQFTVSLTVTDEQGLSDVATALITVSAPPNTAPTAVADATPNATNPLQFTFDGSGSSDSESDLSYSWDFGDGSTSSEAAPSHTYALAGTYDVSLTVTDEGELTDSVTLQVIAEEPVTNDFALRINAGGPQVVHDGETFLADQNFAGGKVYVNASAQVPVLYQTERSASPPTFAYNIPLENGRYQLTLHFAEIYHGATGGGTGGTGKRIFDVTLEGNTILNDYDINADVGPQTVVLKTFEVTISDGVLNMTFDAAGGDGIDQPKLSAITILGIDDPVVACELPEEWTNSDVGTVAAEGDICHEDGRYEVSASGADIWGSADEFHYVYQELEGDGEIIAQVLSLDPTNVWAKAGVMMRNDLDANSASAMMIIAPNPSNIGGPGYSFQHRSTKGTAMGTGSFTAPQLVPGGFPYYVRMVRSGNTFTGYVSATDGNWTQVGSQTIAMNGTIFVGLATTSHNDGTLTEAVYENVSVTKTVVTNEAPSASFVASPTNGIAPLVVNFDSSASNDDKGIVSYAWDFGDGSTSTNQNPQHTFSVGIYEVSLTVTDAEGESDVANVTISSEEPVVADFELRINAGGPQVVHNGETFSADQNFVGGKSYTNVNATVPVLYQTERSALPPNFGYEIPLVNGDYQVTLHFAEIFWSANGGRAGGNNSRIFDVFMEGDNILNDYSIIADVGPQTVVTKTFEVSIQDGALTLNLDAEGSDGRNEPKLSAIEIVSIGSLNAAPTAMADANPVSGEAPLVVDFDGSASDDDMGIVSYLWDFQDGTTSTLTNPQHTFAPGTYEVSLTVTDGEGATDVDTVTITADEPIVNDFALRINAGGPEVVHNGETFAADSNFTGGKAYINNSAAVPALYKTERSALPPSFSYNIPVENGNYQVVLHFAEIYWGATGGGTGGTGKRIFDVALEGSTILNDYDINADVGPQTVTLKTFDVTVVDGILNLAFDAAGSDGVDQPKVSAIEILGEDVTVDNNQAPIVDAGDDVEVILPNPGFTLNGTGSDPDGGAVTYQWTQIDGPDTALLTNANAAMVNVEVLVAGEYNLQLAVTDDEGTTVTDEVTVTAIQGNLDELWLEAECAEIGTGWNTVNDGSASGGQYMVPPAGFNQSTSSIGDAILTFNFSVTEGTYKVFGLVRTPSGTEDSFWIRVNGGPWVRWNSIPPSNSFAWHRIHFNEQLSQPRSFEFVEGINQLEIGHRESGVAIDKLYITQGNDLPNGLGGASSNCDATQQALDAAAADENFGNANKTISDNFNAPIANEVSMFPNAADTSTQITMSNPEADIAKIYVYDVAGRLIRNYEGLELKTGAGAYILQVSNLDSGVYLLRMTATDGSVFDEKLVVRH